MFFLTVRLRPKRLLAAALAAAVALLGAAALPRTLGGAAAADAPASPKGVRDNADRVAYLSAYGWQVKEEPLAVEELRFPKELGAEYADYLSLQAAQGFDLTKLAGKAVKRYTYEITNYPTGETGVQASLLIYRNTVVGGDVLSPALSGFLHGLQMPQSTAQ